jgi:hypothetical protein
VTCLVINSFLASNVPALSATTYTDSQLGPTDALSELTFNNNGALSHNILGTIAGQWLRSVDAVQAALYELEVVITSGSAFNAAGTTAAGSGTWRDLASSWTYGNTFTGPSGTKSTTATFTIRRKSDLVTMASASIAITAEVT